MRYGQGEGCAVVPKRRISGRHCGKRTEATEGLPLRRVGLEVNDEFRRLIGTGAVEGLGDARYMVIRSISQMGTVLGPAQRGDSNSSGENRSTVTADLTRLDKSGRTIVKAIERQEKSAALPKLCGDSVVSYLSAKGAKSRSIRCDRRCKLATAASPFAA